MAKITLIPYLEMFGQSMKTLFLYRLMGFVPQPTLRQLSSIF